MMLCCVCRQCSLVGPHGEADGSVIRDRGMPNFHNHPILSNDFVKSGRRNRFSSKPDLCLCLPVVSEGFATGPEQLKERNIA